MQVLVHGGAGDNPEAPNARANVLETAASTGAAESTPIDAVEAALRVLEGDDRFNAGVGGSVQTDGIARTDAGVMTSDRTVGAACGMPGVEAAVSVARAVLEKTPHVLIAGVHAVDFAESVGIETDVALTTGTIQDRYDAANVPESIDAQLVWLREEFGGTSAIPDGDGARDHDTVGAVAVEDGQLAAATSSGGRWLALRGRVGDVPQVGSGFYATPRGAASTTGAGEDIARMNLAHLAVDALQTEPGAEAAAQAAIDRFVDVTDAPAGVIVADPTGSLGSAHSSPAMQTAAARH